MRHYIFFASNNDYMKVAYNDIFKKDGVIYKTEYLQHPIRLVEKIHSIHVLSRISNKLKFPLKKIWFHHYFKEPFVKGDEYVFVFTYNWREIFDNGYIEFLRRKYRGCFCALFLQDIDCAKRLNILEEKRKFDHIMVFEKNFALEEGVEYYPLVYSNESVEGLNEDRPIDILFIGKAKGRYRFLKSIYNRLSENGVNCQFYLSEIDEDVRPNSSGIHIVDTIPYSSNIELIKKSKCILDIVPTGTNCNTIRFCEAVVYETKILTNNSHILEEEYYNPELISVYSTFEDIDVDFLKKPYENVDYHYKDCISPKALIKHLDSLFENTIKK